MIKTIFSKYTLPAIVHIKKQAASKGPKVLLLTPYQSNKDDIFSKIKEYVEAANLICTCIYENEDKDTQIEKLKSRKCFFNLSYKKLFTLILIGFQV